MKSSLTILLESVHNPNYINGEEAKPDYLAESALVMMLSEGSYDAHNEDKIKTEKDNPEKTNKLIAWVMNLWSKLIDFFNTILQKVKIFSNKFDKIAKTYQATNFKDETTELSVNYGVDEYKKFIENNLDLKIDNSFFKARMEEDSFDVAELVNKSFPNGTKWVIEDGKVKFGDGSKQKLNVSYKDIKNYAQYITDLSKKMKNISKLRSEALKMKNKVEKDLKTKDNKAEIKLASQRTVSYLYKVTHVYFTIYNNLAVDIYNNILTKFPKE